MVGTDEPKTSQNIFDAQGRHDNKSKLRTALFKERDDDEPMLPKIYLQKSLLQFQIW